MSGKQIEALAKLTRYDLAGDYDPYIVPFDEGNYVKLDDVKELLERNHG